MLPSCSIKALDLVQQRLTPFLSFFSLHCFCAYFCDPPLNYLLQHTSLLAFHS